LMLTFVSVVNVDSSWLPYFLLSQSLALSGREC